MSEPDFSGQAAEIIASAATNGQMLQENAGGNPSLKQAVTTDSAALENALAGQAALYARNPALAAAARALGCNPSASEAQAGAGLDITKRIG